MIRKGIFYLLKNNNIQDGLSAIEQLVCNIAATCWRKGKRVLLACENKKQAIRIDNALWIRPLNSFIPHNFLGDGRKIGTPVEISWKRKNNSNMHDILISLRINFDDISPNFMEIIDFVPYEESLKELARKRYKEYRIAGFKLNIAIWK